jgi:SAM-dependent methyltransferase
VLEGLELLKTQVGFKLEGSRVLVPGCGRGSDALALVLAGANVVAVDWSEAAVTALSQRYEELKKSGAAVGQLKVLQGDFFALEPEQVDLVCEHTFFCAIDPSTRTRYVKAVNKWLKPGGYLFGNFFILSEAQAKELPALSMGRDGQGPPFAATEAEVVLLFGHDFVKLILQPAKNPDPKRRPGMEWVGVFEGRRSL